MVDLLFLAVLDGGNPSDEWTPWGVSFRRLTKGVDDLEVVQYVAVRKEFRLQMLEDSPAQLLSRSRSAWSRVVGTVVALGEESAAELAEKKRLHKQLCSNLHGATDALYEVVGGYGLVFIGDPSGRRDFVEELQTEARSTLGPEHVRSPCPVPSREALHNHLIFWAQEIARQHELAEDDKRGRR
jgi:hypothetical protein